MIYKFIDINGSEIAVNSISSLQALVDSETIKESTKVKAGLRGKWTTASKIEELSFAQEVEEETAEINTPEVDIKTFITAEKKTDEVIVDEKSEEVSTQPWQTKKQDIQGENVEKIADTVPEKVEATKQEIPSEEAEIEDTRDKETEDEEKSEYELDAEKEEEKRDKKYDDENIEGLNFFDAIKICLRKYFVIKGRASRSEYWFLQLLFTPLAMYVGFWSDAVSTGTIDPPPLYILSTIIVILLFIPSITSQIRRFHDKDKSGWFIFINIIPLVGWLIALVMLLDKGTPGKNRFGEYPLKSKK